MDWQEVFFIGPDPQPKLIPGKQRGIKEPESQAASRDFDRFSQKTLIERKELIHQRSHNSKKSANFFIIKSLRDASSEDSRNKSTSWVTDATSSPI